MAQGEKKGLAIYNFITDLLVVSGPLVATKRSSTYPRLRSTPQ